uniref:Uncharacterized protein n=1 Tax=Ditylenchus dipsaci TaxID=166011 RepID=A0A915DMT6_9BILA
MARNFRRYSSIYLPSPRERSQIGLNADFMYIFAGENSPTTLTKWTVYPLQNCPTSTVWCFNLLANTWEPRIEIKNAQTGKYHMGSQYDEASFADPRYLRSSLEVYEFAFKNERWEWQCVSNKKMDKARSFIYGGDKLGIYGQGDTARRLRKEAQRDFNETVQKSADATEKEISHMLDHPLITFDLTTHEFSFTKLLPDPCSGFPLRRYGRCPLILQNCLYLVGGQRKDLEDYWNEHTMSTDIGVWIRQHRWNKTVLQLDIPVSYCSAVANSDGFIYVFGGRTCTCMPTSMMIL